MQIRKSVRILLLNDKKELLLIYAKKSKTRKLKLKENEGFWFTIGGGINEDEDIIDAAYREILEETGIEKKDINLGPEVWHGNFYLNHRGRMTLMEQSFYVAYTKKNNVFFNDIDHWEKKCLEKLEWFSFEKIIDSKELIFPIDLKKYLPDILDNKFPKKPIQINISKEE